MMVNIVPLKKQSKRAQKEFHSKRRGSWYGISPVTRAVPSGRTYDRNRIKREDCQAHGEWIIRSASAKQRPSQTAPRSRYSKKRQAAAHYKLWRLCSASRIYRLGLWRSDAAAHRKVHQVSQEQQLPEMAQVRDQPEDPQLPKRFYIVFHNRSTG